MLKHFAFHQVICYIVRFVHANFNTYTTMYNAPVSHIRPELIWLYSAVCLVNINAIKPALIGYRATITFRATAFVQLD